MKNLSNLNKEDLYNKKVFLRADLDVPLENGEIKDTARLKAWFPTLEVLLKNQAHIFIAGHLGRPIKQFSILNSQFLISEPEFSLLPIAEWIAQELNLNFDKHYIDINEFKGWKLSDNLFILENLRFYKEEEDGNKDFAKKLAALAEIYVNDAFSVCHRAHASIVGVPKFIPSFAGLRLEKEVGVLSKVLENPKRPLCVIIGGAKIETKLPLVEKMHVFADYVLVGGEIAENDKVLLNVQHEKINPSAGGQKSVLLVADLTDNLKDITTKSAENFVQIIQNANTIIWNGPMGLVEEKENRSATNILAEGLSKISAEKIVGGGDTIAYLKKNNLLDNFSFVSTGGGAMLEFLAGVKLPGIEALEAK